MFETKKVLFVSLVIGTALPLMKGASLESFNSKSFQNPLINGDSNTYFASKSYQKSVVMDGKGGPPKSEKKMSAFSVEDHQGDGKYEILKIQNRM